MPHRRESYFHLHLVSDATGETLMTVGRAAAVQYSTVSAIEHVYPLVRSQKQLDRVLSEIETSPGIVLYTLVDQELTDRLNAKCKEFGCPCLSVLAPVLSMFQNYLGAASTPRVGAQHVLNAEYFQRIDALNYTMMHDDGQLPENWEEADVLLVGVSRTSKTPTSIYLANRGVKAANIPLVPGIPLPEIIWSLKKPLIVGLFASPERIVQIRENRILTLNAPQDRSSYVDRVAVAEEIAQSRRLFGTNNWPIIDVSRRSIEETAAGIISLLKDHRRALDDRARA
ncbi:pyruvate, water dikinase regulatory protein [Phreatobacter sp.]|uniref:Putative pyruvate, phosphate dikinase regulatory protein n=1 Tax=Microcystis aeruginosa DA14 TaxID=1987506 RepID=A0A3E0ME43_MICAE|nr:pyruvate, water dikinase regulatory protein [Phreatobacter sp.]REJ57848.1 MAG: kinase/pyrophosphorylase [Microcystis aeruginosa DA14]